MKFSKILLSISLKPLKLIYLKHRVNILLGGSKGDNILSYSLSNSNVSIYWKTVPNAGNAVSITVMVV